MGTEWECKGFKPQKPGNGSLRAFPSQKPAGFWPWIEGSFSPWEWKTLGAAPLPEAPNKNQENIPKVSERIKFGIWGGAPWSIPVLWHRIMELRREKAIGITESNHSHGTSTPQGPHPGVLEQFQGWEARSRASPPFPWRNFPKIRPKPLLLHPEAAPFFPVLYSLGKGMDPWERWRWRGSKG